MTDRSLIEQLDLAVQELLSGSEFRPATLDPEIGGLVRVAGDLRHLPRTEFRAQLRSELQRRAEMSSQPAEASKKKVQFRPGFRTVTPYLAVRQAPELIEFVQQAFGAQLLGPAGTGSGGGMHAEVRIADSILMIGGGGAWQGKPRLASLHFYVPDVDAVYQQALAAGATSIYKPIDQGYGDREAGLTDLAGNQWFIATHQATGHAPEGMQALTPYLRAVGAPELLVFLKRAFAADEAELHKDPGGTIVHAKLRIGDSLLELSEAHGRWQPLSSMFYLYVDDADAWYQRALDAGAESISQPADQPYGDRVAAVRDSQGYDWYLGTPIG